MDEEIEELKNYAVGTEGTVRMYLPDSKASRAARQCQPDETWWEVAPEDMPDFMAIAKGQFNA